MDELWYYEYIIKVWDSCDEIIKRYSGIVPGESFADAVGKLEEYYGRDLIEIIRLKELVEGPVLEFQLLNDEANADFYISEKRKENDK